LTVKSLSGGAYGGMENPTGAVARANQSAVTQPPTVIIQATSGGNPIVAATKNTSNGNLGGQSGADAFCVAEFGSGWRIANLGHLMSARSTINPAVGIWFDDRANNCNNWTDATSATFAYTYSVSGTYFAQYQGMLAGCNTKKAVLCANF
jgi:hypothetical protein